MLVEESKKRKGFEVKGGETSVQRTMASSNRDTRFRLKTKSFSSSLRTAEQDIKFTSQ